MVDAAAELLLLELLAAAGASTKNEGNTEAQTRVLRSWRGTTRTKVGLLKTHDENQSVSPWHTRRNRASKEKKEKKK